MSINKEAYKSIVAELGAGVTLVAVSKTKPAEDILQLYELGHRDFGENYVQELVSKQEHLPKDIRWHFIGHLQRNKVKYISPFVHLVHGVDSFKLLDEINNQGTKLNRIIDCLLQVHIATEETKFGFDEEELIPFVDTISRYQMLNKANNIRICGLMGMASFTEDMDKVRAEFKRLKRAYDKLLATRNNNLQTNFKLGTLSMGMSSDYKVAIEEGSNMVRIGSLIFGERN
jgi:pyridoxal phosphate enzyme (YggS family)